MYYTLLIRFDNEWTIQFGDYSKGTVHDEIREWRTEGFTSKDIRIICTNPEQSEINRIVNRWNHSVDNPNKQLKRSK